MRLIHAGFVARALVGTIAALTLVIALAPPLHAGAKVYEDDDFSLELGLRMQPRLVVSRFSGFGDDDSRQRNFMVRRARIKASGKMMGATYSLEWRLDGTGLISGLVLTAPVAGVENAWLQFPITNGGGLDIRVGLYDQPYSRDRLTSDSKQLAVDRGLVSSVPAILGLADNVIGIDVRGKLQEGRYTYVAGVYDNRTIPGRFQPDPMLVGRIDLNLGSSKNVYHDAHFGNDSWYSLGLNGNYQNAIEDTTTAGVVQGGGRTTAVGVDGMIDIPLGPGRLFAMAEFNNIQRRLPGSTALIDTRVWGTGVGYLLWQRLQPILRFDQVRKDDGGQVNQTHIGMNFYKRGHNLKFQGDVVLIAGTNESLDLFRMQAQIDF